MWPYLELELRSMGASGILKYKDEGEVWHVIFSWSGRRREIIYLNNTDVRNISSIKESLSRVAPVDGGFEDIDKRVNGGFDLYYECATDRFVPAYSVYMKNILPLMGRGGRMVVDDHDEHRFRLFRDSSYHTRHLLKPVNPDFIDPMFWRMIGYGREMYIYVINENAKIWPLVLVSGFAAGSVVLALFFGNHILDFTRWILSYINGFIGGDVSNISGWMGYPSVSVIPAFYGGLRRFGWAKSPDITKRVLFGSEYEFPGDVYRNIRPAVPADAESIREIRNQFLPRTERAYSVEEYAGIARDHILNDGSGTYHLLVYEDRGIVKGYGIASYDGSAEVPTLSLRELAVMPEVRAKGVGYAITGRLLEAVSGNRVSLIEGIVESLYCAKIVMRFGLRCRHPNEDGTGVYIRDIINDRDLSRHDMYGYKEDDPVYGLRASQGLYTIVEEEMGDAENTVNFRAITTDGRELGRVAISIEDIAWIEDAHVMSVARKKDVGEALIKRAFEYLRRMGKGKVLVYCEVDNAIGEFFYKGVASKLGLVIETWQPHDNKEAVIFAYDIRERDQPAGNPDVSDVDGWLKANARLLSVDGKSMGGGLLWFSAVSAPVPFAGKIILAGIIYLYVCAHKEELLNWLRTKSGKDKWYSSYANILAVLSQHFLINLSRNKFTRSIARSFRQPIGATISSEGFGDDIDEFSDPFSDRGPSAARLSVAIASIPADDKITLSGGTSGIYAKRFRAIISITKDILNENGDMSAMRNTLQAVRDRDGRNIFEYKDVLLRIVDILESSEVNLVKCRDKLTGIPLPAVFVSTGTKYSYYAEPSPARIYFSYDIFTYFWNRSQDEIKRGGDAGDEYMRFAISYLLAGAAMLSGKEEQGAIVDPETVSDLLNGPGNSTRSKLAVEIDSLFEAYAKNIPLKRDRSIKEALAKDYTEGDLPEPIMAILRSLSASGDLHDYIRSFIRNNRLTPRLVRILENLRSRGDPVMAGLAHAIWRISVNSALHEISADPKDPSRIASAYVDFPVIEVFDAALKSLSKMSQVSCGDFLWSLHSLDPEIKKLFFRELESFAKLSPAEYMSQRERAVTALSARNSLINET
ncbi:MAG TPA: hypothetical protein PLV52_02850, partial [Candidatus Omnitrophota bacterium]|nr:hypothetical protein [Candidatus Omnitrophota bacterium]